MTEAQYVLPEEKIKIQQVAQKPLKPKKNLGMTLILYIVMLGMTIVLRGIFGGGGTFVIYISFAMFFAAFIKEKKDYQKEWEKCIAYYQKYIDEKLVMIEVVRANELRARNLIYKSWKTASGRLWKEAV